MVARVVVKTYKWVVILNLYSCYMTIFVALGYFK